MFYWHREKNNSHVLTFIPPPRCQALCSCCYILRDTSIFFHILDSNEYVYFTKKYFGCSLNQSQALLSNDPRNSYLMYELDERKRNDQTIVSMWPKENAVKKKNETATIILSLFIVQLFVMTTICWTWFNVFSSGLSDFGLESPFLIIAVVYYFAMTVWSYVLLKTWDQKHVVLQILLIVLLSGSPLVSLLF
jgi:hypothetical protein